MPKSRTLSGILIDKQYNRAFNKLKEILNDSQDLTLFSDGWTDCRGDHVVNFLVKAPSKPTIFYKSIVTSGTVQHAGNVAEAITNVVEELGAEKFASIVTDNAPVMKLAWKKIEEKHPNIKAFGCAAHCLNLLIKDILEPHGAGKKLHR